MMVEVVGGPYDGKQIETTNTFTNLSIPIRIPAYTSDEKESLLPTFKIATMPIVYTERGYRVYWSTRSEK